MCYDAISPEKREEVIAQHGGRVVTGMSVFQGATAGQSRMEQTRRTSTKFGRNEMCPCGSAKKCGRRYGGVG
ncbi:MAG: SEC-C metal-binding domain-containing protein, partial [Terriglobales bacterium]